MGAGVPNPCNAKRAKESKSPGIPAAISAIPITRVTSVAKNGGRKCQRVINQGTSPSIITGAAMKNSAEPKIGLIFDSVTSSRLKIVAYPRIGAPQWVYLLGGPRARPWTNFLRAQVAMTDVRSA